mgnify:CR=1 FL=1
MASLDTLSAREIAAGVAAGDFSAVYAYEHPASDCVVSDGSGVCYQAFPESVRRQDARREQTGIRGCVLS